MDNVIDIKEVTMPTGAEGSRALLAPATPSLPAAGDEFTVEDYRTILRFLTGAVLEGGDELVKRLKIWLDTTQKMEQDFGVPIAGIKDLTGKPLLYTLIGLLFKTPEYLNQGLQTTDELSTRVASFVSRFTGPVTRSRLFRPVRNRYRSIVGRGENEIASLQADGRAQASLGRTLVRRQINEDTLQEILIYLVEQSKMQEMMIETTSQVGGDALTEVRGASATVDNSLDNLIAKILRRQKRQQGPPAAPSTPSQTGNPAP